MRIRALTLLAALLLVPAATVATRRTKPAEPAADEPSIGSVDFGGQFTTTTGDEGRYERYKDLRSGALLDAFRVRPREGCVAVQHDGRRTSATAISDTRRSSGPMGRPRSPSCGIRSRSRTASAASGISSGSSTRRRTPASVAAEYRLDDSLQTQVEAVCPTTPCTSAQSVVRQALLYKLVTAQAQSLDIRHRRDTLLLNATINLAPHTDLLLHVQNTTKSGEQPWNASFGFSQVVELPAPVDTRSTDIGAAIQFSNEKGMVKAGWDGSWFHNNVGFAHLGQSAAHHRLGHVVADCKAARTSGPTAPPTCSRARPTTSCPGTAASTAIWASRSGTRTTLCCRSRSTRQSHRFHWIARRPTPART